jgi:hypothetical protein
MVSGVPAKWTSIGDRKESRTCRDDTGSAVDPYRPALLLHPAHQLAGDVSLIEAVVRGVDGLLLGLAAFRALRSASTNWPALLVETSDPLAPAGCARRAGGVQVEIRETGPGGGTLVPVVIREYQTGSRRYLQR